MWINDKKINFEKIVSENGLIVKHKNIPVMTGLGDEIVWECEFENGSIFNIEFIPNEFEIIIKNLK